MAADTVPVTIHNHTPLDLVVQTFNSYDRIQWLSKESCTIKPTYWAKVNASGLVFFFIEVSYEEGGVSQALKATVLRGKHYIIDVTHTGKLGIRVWNRPEKAAPTTDVTSQQPAAQKPKAPTEQQSTITTSTPTKGQPEDADNILTCKICMEARINSVILPCGHVVACESCLKQLPSRECPICREKITETKTLFWP